MTATAEGAAPPRILLVGDNRASYNWGGRAAGLALFELLGARAEIADTIRGSELLLESAEYGMVSGLLPGPLHALQHRARQRHWFAAIDDLLGAHDFIRAEPEETVRAIRRHKDRDPGLDRLFRLVSEADAVVVNGEGDLVFSDPPRREALFLLALAALGLELGKPVLVVNALLSDCPSTGRHPGTHAAAHRLFARCAEVLVRDPTSLAYLRETMPGVRADWIPDALFAWYPRARDAASCLPANGDAIVPFPEDSRLLGRLDFSRPYICVGGSATVGRDRARARKHYAAMVDALGALGLPIVLAAADGPDTFLLDIALERGLGYLPVTTPIVAATAVLARARLFVSGRYHPSIMASMGGTPCVFLGSAGHKMTSLQEVLGYGTSTTFGVLPSPAECRRIAELGRDYLQQGEGLRDHLSSVARTRYERTRFLANCLPLGGRAREIMPELQ